MPFTIDSVVPWGRTMAEYRGMFNLGESDLCGRILGCGDGPASFNAEMSAQGRAVVSVDPLYAFPAAAIERRVEETYDIIIEQVTRNRGDFVWTYVPSIPALGRRRMGAMRRFLADFPQGMREGRYVDASLPDLPFDDNAFDLALSSHFLFLYSEQFDIGFHLRALQEMLRVSGEARVFPLLQIGGAPSPHVEAVLDTFAARGVRATIEFVRYEFQRGGNRMLRLAKAARDARIAESGPGSHQRDCTMAVLPHSRDGYDPINTRSNIPGARIITARTCGATQMELWEQYMPPDGVIPVHYHDCEESITFLSGEVEVTLGEERHLVGADTTLFVPEGALHGVRNVGRVPVRLIAFFSRSAPAILYPDRGTTG